jgi:urease accessory protein
VAEERISLCVSPEDAPANPRTGLRGHLRLVAGLNKRGLTCLREQSFAAPVHLGKTYLEQETLVAQVVNPTAGLLEGDELRIDVRVEPGARLLLTQPAATRVYTMRGGCASVIQDFFVAAGGWLEVLPDLFIPQKGSSYEQKTAIGLETGASLLFFEILAPGRVAAGEVFAFHRIDWNTDIRLDGSLVARERYRLSPDTPSLFSLQARFPHAYQANFFAFGKTLTGHSSCWNELLALQNDDVLVGSSPLTRDGWIVKVLARDSLVLRRVMEKIRESLHRAMGAPCIGLRKN